MNTIYTLIRNDDHGSTSSVDSQGRPLCHTVRQFHTLGKAVRALRAQTAYGEIRDGSNRTVTWSGDPWIWTPEAIA